MSDRLELGKRLRMARERLELSQADAAEAVGVNRVVLNYYEVGRRDIPLTTASALARLYGTTIEALLERDEPPVSQLDVAGLLFRATPAAVSEGSRTGAHLFERFVSDYVELADDLDVPLAGPRPSPFPSPRGTAAKFALTAARQLRDFLGLDSGPIEDLFTLVDEHILVWRLPLGEDLDEAPSGFFYRHPRAGECIVVNSDMTLGRQIFTLAHELAHAFFHSQGTDIIVSTRRERQTARERFADVFAGEFLVPADALHETVAELQAWEDLADPTVVVHLQRHFGVSYATLIVRLRQERLIDEATYRTLRDTSPSRLARALGYQVHRADLGRFEMHPLERFPAAMLTLVAKALAAGEITLGDAAETLGASTEDLRPLLGPPPADDRDRSASADLEDAVGLD